MRAAQWYKKTFKGFLALSLALSLAMAASPAAWAHHAPPAPPTNLMVINNMEIPVRQALSWTPSQSAGVAYTAIYRDNIRLSQTTNNYYTFNNDTDFGGRYTVRAVDTSHGYEVQSTDSNTVTVTLAYYTQINGSPWNSCFTPNAHPSAKKYAGCFASNTSMYALRNVNVKYKATSVRSGSAYIDVDYRQKTAALPLGFTKYDVNVIVSAGTNWKYVTTLQLPAAGPGVPKTHTAPLNIPIDHPDELELQWINDTSNSSGDANLQIDRITLRR